MIHNIVHNDSVTLIAILSLSLSLSLSLPSLSLSLHHTAYVPPPKQPSSSGSFPSQDRESVYPNPSFSNLVLPTKNGGSSPSSQAANSRRRSSDMGLASATSPVGDRRTSTDQSSQMHSGEVNGGQLHSESHQNLGDNISHL